MAGLFNRDYTKLTAEEIQEKDKIDAEGGYVVGAKFGRRNFFHKYPKAVRHNMSLFPNNYMDVLLLKDIVELEKQCNGFETLLNDTFRITVSIMYQLHLKHTNQTLPDEFVRFDSSRMNYVVVAGRRQDFDNPTSRQKQRRSEQENNIKILHYDNLLDDARRLIGAPAY